MEKAEPASSVDVATRAWGRDVVAGLIDAVVSVPDGLASAALAGVNPVCGLYASIAGPITGSLLVSAQLMQVSTTRASALAAGQAVAGQPEAQRDQAMFQAVVLILDQAAPLVGVSPTGRNEVSQFVDLLRHAPDFGGQALPVGALAIGIVAGPSRTRFAAVSSLVALLVPSLLVALIGLRQVQLVADVSEIPRGVPSLTLPNLAPLTPELLMSAAAVAVVEEQPPARLESEEVTVLAVYGSLFFAGARTLERALRSPFVGAALVQVLDEYADDRAEAGGRLYLSGVGEELAGHLRRAGTLDLGETAHVVPANAVVGESTAEALASARAWLGRASRRPLSESTRES